MKLLITGGAGYVGGHCAKLLCERGYEVVIFDNLCQGHYQAVHEDAELVLGDLLDRQSLEKTFQQHHFDVVMHFASLLNVAESVKERQRYYENNVLGSMNLVGEMMRSEVRRLVFSSSCAVYGIPPAVPITEDMPKHPINPYGRTKWIVEMALQDCARADGLGSVSLRYFNAAGAARDGTLGEDRDPEYHLIPIILQVALNQRERIEIYGTDYPTRDGTAVRDYIHVEDLAAAHVCALDVLELGKAKSYNVGTGQGYSVREVLETARRVTGCEIPAVESSRREGDPPELFADPSLICEQMNWQPRCSGLEEVVSTAWNWHRAHPRGYGN